MKIIKTVVALVMIPTIFVCGVVFLLSGFCLSCCKTLLEALE
jgi:hypothetical protein